MFTIEELLIATQGQLIQGNPDLRVKGISIDSRTIKPNEAFLAIRGDKFDGYDFIAEAIKKEASCIIVISGRNYINKVSSLEIKKKLAKVVIIEVKDTTRALGDIGRHQRKKFDIPLVAITGSNGKTTTKEMIAWILSKKFIVLKNEGTKNNQIGLPLALLNLNPNYEIAVLELGTNHFGEIEYLSKICQANIGIITNIGSSHLEYLKNSQGVLKEKCDLIENLSKPYLALLNADDDFLAKRLKTKAIKPFILGFGIAKQSDFLAYAIKFSWYSKKWTSPQLEFIVNRKNKFTLKTLGYYNVYNALAAIAIARLFGMEYKEIAFRLATFDFPQMRLKFIEFNKTKFIDDTYNSNPLSLNEALEVLRNLKTQGRKIFVMGDMCELGSRKNLFHQQAGRLAASVCNTFITVGEAARFAAEAAKKCGFSTNKIYTCESSSDARDILFDKISPRKNDIVLVKGSRLMKMEEIFKV
jgi:UDP-N-acetylmuramoyl-tripeptide--D-alanyl-D-alanine ligase